MLPDPTERNVNRLLFQTEIRTVKKLVLTLDIHDKNVTMAKPARVSFTVRTGLALPFEERLGTEAHRHNEPRIPTLSKQRLIIAQECDSPPQSSKQYECEQRHEESGSTDHAVWYDTFFSQSPVAAREEKSPISRVSRCSTIPPT